MTKEKKVGEYFLRKPLYKSTSYVRGWTLERAIEPRNGPGNTICKSYMIATFDGGVNVSEVEEIINKLNGGK